MQGNVCVALLKPTKKDLSKKEKNEIGIKPNHLEKYSNDRIVGALVLSRRFSLSVLQQNSCLLSPMDMKFVLKFKKKNPNYEGHFIQKHYWFKTPIPTDMKTQSRQNVSLTDPLLRNKEFNFIHKLTRTHGVTIILFRIMGSFINAIKSGDKRYEYRNPIESLNKGCSLILNLTLHKISDNIESKTDIIEKNQKNRQGCKRAKRLYNIHNELQKYIIQNMEEKTRYNPKKDLFVLYCEYYFAEYDVTDKMLYDARGLNLNVATLNRRKYKKVPIKTWDHLVSNFNRGETEAQS